MANLSKSCTCKPPNLDAYSNISFLYLAGIHLRRRSFVILLYWSIYSFEGFGRDSRMCVIMLQTRLFSTDIFPLSFIVRFLLFHCLIKTSFTCGYFKLHFVLVIYCKSRASNSEPKSTITCSFHFIISYFFYSAVPFHTKLNYFSFLRYSLSNPTPSKKNSVYVGIKSYFNNRVVSLAYSYILFSFPDNCIPLISLISLMASPNISAQITKM